MPEPYRERKDSQMDRRRDERDKITLRACERLLT